MGNMKTPPQNIESEKIVIGSMLLNNDYVPELLMQLKQKYFYEKEHQDLFAIIKRLYETQKPIDVVSVYEAVKTSEIKISAITISKLTEYSYAVGNPFYHALIIAEKYILRELIIKAKEIEERAYNQSEDVFDLIQQSIIELEQVINIKNDAKEEKNLYEQMDDIFQQITDEREGKKQPSLKTTNHPSFNDSTGGIRGGNVIAISGNYKQGKTTFGTAIILDFAVTQKKKIGWFSLEISEYEMNLKFISMVTATRYGYLRDPANKNHYGEFRYRDESLKETITNASRKFYETNIYVNDCDLDIFRIITKLKLWRKKYGIEIACIDYIGLIENPGKNERRDLEIAELSRKLKNTARELDIPIFILSQENEEGKTADSKALLRDADFWFSTSNLLDKGLKVWKIEDNDGKYEVAVDNSYFEVKNKGNRHGPAGKKILYKYNENGTYNEVDYKRSNNLPI